MNRNIILCIIAALLLAACGSSQKKSEPAAVEAAVIVPIFDADSAYSFVASQVAFGPRVPNSEAHRACGDYLENKLRAYGAEVVAQNVTLTAYNGDKLQARNIIAQFQPQNKKRVMLCAHWDSRPWADSDPDKANHYKPILGANDGASGVAVLMEMARVMSAMPPDVGVDFIFFDVEDQGIAEWAGRYEDNTWCKGSQHWAQNPHRMFYQAEYGILYDMVGTDQPRFTKEEISMGFAQGLMNRLWNCAAFLGYGNIFVDELSGAILDDHLYVNQILRIPTIDIVQNSPNCSFYPHWHTTDDDLDAINKETLHTVATVSLKLIYSDFPNKTQQQ